MPVDVDLAVVGTAYHAPRVDQLDVLADYVIAVDMTGVIVDVAPIGDQRADDLVSSARRLVRLEESERLLPGLIDTHIHAPQWPQLGTGLDLPLEEWLFAYTFPLEARYVDESFADRVWRHMVPSLLAHGTTTAVYFSSIHEGASRRLAEVCGELGQRAFVGRVAMDHPEGTPEWYRDISVATGVDASARSIDDVLRAGGDASRIRPIVTPRFVPACTDDLLRGLGQLASSTGQIVQTHCSESDWAHGYVLERFGSTDSYVLDGFGLLRESTVLAHADHLTDDDMDRVRGRRAGVAHCPLSNSYFANAVFPLRRALDRGVRVGLGSDVAGGPTVGLLPQCSHAVTVSRMLEDGVDPRRSAEDRGVPDSRIDTVTAFHVATVGGAELLGIPVGSFEVGRKFDAFTVDVDSPGSALRRWDEVDDEARLFEKIVRVAGSSDITHVWVDGRRVAGCASD
ncbi:MAG: guanine deaminase [Actinomycetota bacterium]